jgi:DNA-binding transcriptional MocR family regulator
MSLEAVTWVKNLDYDACTLGPFRVLLILAEHADSEGKRAFRAKRKLAAVLGVSDRSIQRWYKELLQDGLIRVGDQAYVAHIPADRRPVVYDVCMFRNEALHQAELVEHNGETELSTGDDGETTAVADGETTAVALRTKDINPLRESTKANHSAQARSEEDRCAGRPHLGHQNVGGYCMWCSVRLEPYEVHA